ncbi:ABC-three component system middle component 2 [Vibrio cyclitrophicus]
MLVLLNNELSVFNTHLEAGVRSLVFLNSTFPNSFDLNALLVADYVIVNSEDFNGPKSLHPKAPNRSGALVVRRETVFKGVELMISCGLIKEEFKTCGINYRATGDAQAYIRQLKTEYSKQLKIRSEWLSNSIVDGTIEFGEISIDSVVKI